MIFNIFGNNCQDEGTIAILKSVIDYPKIQNLDIEGMILLLNEVKSIQNLLKTSKLREFSLLIEFLGTRNQMDIKGSDIKPFPRPTGFELQ